MQFPAHVLEHEVLQELSQEFSHIAEQVFAQLLLHVERGDPSPLDTFW